MSSMSTASLESSEDKSESPLSEAAFLGANSMEKFFWLELNLEKWLEWLGSPNLAAFLKNSDRRGELEASAGCLGHSKRFNRTQNT